MRRLRHNGILVQRSYDGKGLVIRVRGKEIVLTPEQEEMAQAWARKIGTTYVEDQVFAKNFHRDFSKKLGIQVDPGDVDFSEILAVIEEERKSKENLSKEERKRLATERKDKREENKEFYGYAWVDSERVEIANYAAEPSCIFMGRGKHPLRGRWKEGPSEEDIELNLSPDAPKPKGNWKDVIWQPESMWIARWRDKLAGKMKYVWFSDSSTMKQKKDVQKFNQARKLRRSLQRIKKHIKENLDSKNPKRRKTATVCYLIDELKIRVGDEKDPDEADTVGASTLRPEHIQYNGDGTVTFNFLGKDAVPHIFKISLPGNVIRNLQEFSQNANSTLFDGIRSQQVSEFLDEMMTGLSAKVFRTCYASQAVDTNLEETLIKPKDPDYAKKYTAKMANLEAAKICNHRRQIPKNWKSSLEKNKARLEDLESQAKKKQKKLKRKAKKTKERYRDLEKKREDRIKEMEEKLEAYLQELNDRKQQGKPVRSIKQRIESKREAIVYQKQLLIKLKAKHNEWMKKLDESMKKRRKRDKAAVEKLRLQIEAKKETRDYNLSTSLKSYIDPRIYYNWGKKVDYDWKQYYPKALRSKFSWVEDKEKSVERD